MIAAYAAGVKYNDTLFETVHASDLIDLFSAFEQLRF